MTPGRQAGDREGFKAKAGLLTSKVLWEELLQTCVSRKRDYQVILRQDLWMRPVRCAFVPAETQVGGIPRRAWPRPPFRPEWADRSLCRCPCPSWTEVFYTRNENNVMCTHVVKDSRKASLCVPCSSKERGVDVECPPCPLPQLDASPLPPPKPLFRDESGCLTALRRTHASVALWSYMFLQLMCSHALFCLFKTHYCPETYPRRSV